MNLRLVLLIVVLGLVSFAAAEDKPKERKKPDVIVKKVVIKITKVITKVVKLTPEQMKQLDATLLKQVTTVVENWIAAGKPKIEPLNPQIIETQIKTALSSLPCQIGKQVASGHTDLLADVQSALDADLADLVAGLNSVLGGLGTIVASLIVGVVELVVDALLALIDPIVDIAEDTVEGILDLI